MKKDESEETEVKNKAELKSWFEDDKLYVGEYVKHKINRLDEPEVLSQKWIDENKSLINGRSTNPDGTEGDCYDAHYIHVLELQNLLVPKQELPVIPKFVAEWVDSRKNNYPFDVIGAYIRMNEPFANEQTREVLSWIHESELNRGSFARAWLDGFTVEKEQKYYVINKQGAFVLRKDTGGVANSRYTKKEVEKLGEFQYYQLTEQEIKDYDERYFAFAVKVEELEE